MDRKKISSRFKAFQFKNLLKKQPVPDTKIDKSEGFTKWETATENNKNNFPQQLLQDIQSSPVGTAALDVWEEFVQGAGFVEDIGNVLVNKKETLDRFHSKISSDITLLWGCAIHIDYNAEGKPVNYTHLPFESVRLGEIDDKGMVKDIKYNPYYGIPRDFRKEDTKWYYTYSADPDKVIAEIQAHERAYKDEKNKQITEPYPGQVYWFSIESPLHRVYPQPFYYSAINWFRIDKEIQLFHQRNIKNNFLLSVLFNVPGNPDDPAGEQDSDGDYLSTVGEEFDKQMQSFTDNSGGALVNWFTDEKEKADIQSFPTNSNHDLFIALQKLTDEQISIGTKVPQILLSIAQSGKLGDTQEILNAIRLMQSRTKRYRDIPPEIYAEVFKNSGKFNKGTNFETKTVNPEAFLPSWVVESLNDQEKRDYVEKHFDIELTKSNTEGVKTTIETNG